MKNQQLMEEMESALDDKVEKAKILEGFLGYIVSSAQVWAWDFVFSCSLSPFTLRAPFFSYF